MRSESLKTPLRRAIRPGVKPRGWGLLLHHPLPMSKCRGKHCHLRSKCREGKVSQPRSASAIKAKDSSGRAVEPPLEVMPISVWSPPAQSVEPPPSIAKDLRREHLKADGDEDSLLSNSKLAASAISSILKDSDLKRSDALPVEEALALSLQGVASVSSLVFICLSLSWF